MLNLADSPFAVGIPSFRFPAIATLAGRLPIGAGREAVLALLLVARIAGDATSPRALPQSVREKRSLAARQWLLAMCPDSRVRSACMAVVEAAATDPPTGLPRSLQKVTDVTSAYLDSAARDELVRLAKDCAGADGSAGVSSVAIHP